MRHQIDVDRGRGAQELIKMFVYTAKMLYSHIYQHRGGKSKADHHQPRQEIFSGGNNCLESSKLKYLVFRNFKMVKFLFFYSYEVLQCI